MSKSFIVRLSVGSTARQSGAASNPASPHTGPNVARVPGPVPPVQIVPAASNPTALVPMVPLYPTEPPKVKSGFKSVLTAEMLKPHAWPIPSCCGKTRRIKICTSIAREPIVALMTPQCTMSIGIKIMKTMM